MFKTIAALTYISDEAYRRRIIQMLNKGERLHGLARDLFFGQQGVFQDHAIEAQLNRATCLSLLINAIIVWNTRSMMQALDYLRQTDYDLHEEDIRYLTPLLWEHITFHGSYQFNVSEAQSGLPFRPLRSVQ